MKIETIAVTNVPTLKGVVELKKSLIKHNIPNKIIVTPWEGFYTKVNEAYKYCQTTDADYILFVDAHDVVFVGGLDDVDRKIKEIGCPDAIFSAEKAIWPPPEAWPDPSLINKYPDTASPWRYLNSGTYLIRPELLIELVESQPPKIGVDDQMYFGRHYLKNLGTPVLGDSYTSDLIELDFGCEIFQTLAHDDGSSFCVVNGVFTNLITNSNPTIIHGNGLAFDEFDYSYLNEL